MGFKENLKLQLEYSGMLVKELAARSGVKKKTIDSYLSAQSYIPSAESAVRIAKALGVSVEYLVTGTDSPGNLFTSCLSIDLQEIVTVYKQLNLRDRNILLNLAHQLRAS
jgi:transcriptional regulator with XRE-family HTH domain